MMDKEQEQKKAWLREYRLSMERVRSLAEELRRFGCGGAFSLCGGVAYDFFHDW